MKPETRSFYELAVQRAIERVASDLDQALDLQGLARAAALSPFHFHRVFRGLVGETPLELLRRLRLERAAWYLLHAGSSVTDVAFAAGYETHEAFTRAFRARYSCSPSEFRQRRHAEGPAGAHPTQVELAARSGIHFQPGQASIPSVHLDQMGPALEVELKEMPELRVATVRHLGPYNRISEAFARLGELAVAAELIGPDAAMLALYHDDPEMTPGPDLRSDAAIVVSPGSVVPGGMRVQRIPAGLYACTAHVGSCTQLGDVWARFMGEWLPRSGHRMGEGASYELYRNRPSQGPGQAQAPVTELHIQLARSA
ncbi:AraC family transcriptional regulator [Anaeromyxobacter oryzae]|uniref:AraC family transcriptional regulator n=1 Tax=Anaeromyxobacter oryzae TaxID=2918170 RepID=A0ABN6MVK4_9BACT|nr:AraC family transcriptional regulator [Anaeromyxobacter oryzae]BDG05019.1 AraC family transcriptional regulator [Anaeromyxobacter oryzae]